MNTEYAKLSDTVAGQAARITKLEKMVTDASHALRSYEFGNASPELAKSIADECDAVLAASN